MKGLSLRREALVSYVGKIKDRLLDLVELSMAAEGEPTPDNRLSIDVLGSTLAGIDRSLKTAAENVLEPSAEDDPNLRERVARAQHRRNRMKLREIVRRSVGLMDDSGRDPNRDETDSLFSGPLRRLRGGGEGFVPRAFVTRSAYDQYKIRQARAALAAEKRRPARRPQGHDSGWRVERSGGLLNRARAVMTPRAAARQSVGLRNAPAPDRSGFAVRDAMALENAKGAPPASMATRAAPEPQPLPGFTDRNGQRWVSRAAYDAFGPKPQPPGVPFLGGKNK